MTDSRLAPSFLPSTAVLEMTYLCNHACLFCSCPWYTDTNDFDIRPEMSAQEWKDLIAKLCEMGCNNIAFTGGEPLLKEGIMDIIEFTAAQKVEWIETVDDKLQSSIKPPKLFLLSNGKIMSDAVLDLCAKHNINLSMSLPGLTTFPEHSQGGIDAAHILNWFRRAKEKNVPTTVGVTVTKQNIHELFETIAEALIAGADTLLMNRFLPGGRGLEHADELTLSREQLTEMLDIGEEVLQSANRDGSVGTELPKCMVDEDKYKRLTVGTRCSAALDFFVVDPSGYTRVCNHSTKRLVHVDQIEDLKTDPYWKRFTMKDYLPARCNACSLMGTCDGGCREAAHIVGGCVDSPDPVLEEDYAVL